ncbi:uncharacterized protein LOC107273136 isoform X2 [Cephus cinctus]|uniref:Uncharacterized protein LOC107273136 isoform X2 n=1 Tax=Cephus cinctus TaxID=211228 RepID=A0AAJ7CBA1_CEPCN|nr:uncharacterized protein LOC107273136 isoform X2 [Cephus cinctus]
MYKSCQIMNTSSDDEHYEYQKYLYRKKEWPGYKKVNDGTGAITVIKKIHNLESEQNERKRIDEKHKRLAKAAFLGKKWQRHDSMTEPLPIRFPKVRPDIEYDSEIPLRYRAYLEHKWYEEVNHGLLGKPIELYDYVHVKGFIQLNFEQYPAPEKEISFEDICVANPYIVASRGNFELINEYDYNKKMLEIMNNVKKRYKRPE